MLAILGIFVFHLCTPYFLPLDFHAFRGSKNERGAKKRREVYVIWPFFSQRIIEEVLPEKGAFSRFSLPELLKFYVSSRSDPIFQIAVSRTIRLRLGGIHR